LAAQQLGLAPEQQFEQSVQVLEQEQGAGPTQGQAMTPLVGQVQLQVPAPVQEQ
jgi:hypothetical protein